MTAATPSVSPSPAMFTVDVEPDWAMEDTRGVREVLPRLIELLESYSASATFFVVGALADRVAGIIPSDGHHEVGSHSLTHPVLTSIPDAQLRHEVRESKRLLELHGYDVSGFRSPFGHFPPSLPRELADAGYAYDSSTGPLFPGRRRGAPPPVTYAANGLPRLSGGLLRDQLTPCTLTWLRIYHPFGLRMAPDRPPQFVCHLHELLDDTKGWHRLPPPLRQIHKKGAGPTAWRIVETLLAKRDVAFVSCREYLAATPTGGSHAVRTDELARE